MIVSSFWHGKCLSDMHILCIESFLSNGIEYHLYSYDLISNLPYNIKVLDANLVVDRSFLFYDSKNSLASFSDLFRYSLLYKFGGIWVDVDFFCLPKFFNLNFSFPFVSSELSVNGNVIISNFVLSFPPKHILMYLLMSSCYSQLSNIKSITWGDFGANLIYNVLNLYNLDCFVFSPVSFAALNWFDLHNYKNLLLHLDLSDSYGLHLWNEKWCLEKIECVEFLDILEKNLFFAIN